MKYTVIYKRQFQRSRSMDIESDSLAAVRMPETPVNGFWVEHIIDWENKTVHNVTATDEGRLVKVVDGEYGEATSAGYFIDNDLCEEFMPTEKEII